MVAGWGLIASERRMCVVPELSPLFTPRADKGAVAIAGCCALGISAGMAIIIKQRSRYLRHASLCYDVAVPLTRDKAAEMVRLGNLYSDLAEALRRNDAPDCPECPRCGLKMTPRSALRATELLPMRQVFHCVCGEFLTCRKRDWHSDVQPTASA
jgi:hypothetical protein